MFIGPPKILGPPLNLAPPKFNFLLSSPSPNYFGLKFLGPPKIRGAATMIYHLGVHYFGISLSFNLLILKI